MKTKMKLHNMTIRGFRRIRDAQVSFGDATFLIGPNNAGKSSILKALQCVLSAEQRIDSTDFYAETDPETGKPQPVLDEASIEVEIRNVPEEAHEWRGFKGRIFGYNATETDESGLCIFYRKTFHFSKKAEVELKSCKRTLKPEFDGLKMPSEYIAAGAPEAIVEELFDDLDKNISKPNRTKLDDINELWDITDEEEWFLNPGGIPGVVLARLPRVLIIPAEIEANEIHGDKKGVLNDTLSELFEEVRDVSENYKNAQEHLNLLAKELDPEDADSEFGKMLGELNDILDGVFPDSTIHATADLSDPNKALKPSFNVELSSNVRTPIQNQGTGMIRSAVFGILRYRQQWLERKEEEHARSLIIGFEEPEIYLHPSAANQMRDTLYDLSSSDAQIVCTTHSPYMIDLSRKPRQVLNRMICGDSGIRVKDFTTSDSFKSLINDDKNYVKMLMKMDDYLSRVFFTKNILIIEGDTEDIVLRESIARLPKDKYLRLIADWEIVKARGKAAIISLSKYLVSMEITPTIMHDLDSNTPGAVVFNQPIQDAANGGTVVTLSNCIEDALGYSPPSANKPHKAYVETLSWGEDWEDIPATWRQQMKDIFGDYVP